MVKLPTANLDELRKNFWLGHHRAVLKELKRRNLDPEKIEMKYFIPVLQMYMASGETEEVYRWAKVGKQRDSAFAFEEDGTLLEFHFKSLHNQGDLDGVRELAKSTLEEMAAKDANYKKPEDVGTLLHVLSGQDTLSKFTNLRLPIVAQMFHFLAEYPLALRCYQLSFSAVRVFNQLTRVDTQGILSTIYVQAKYYDNEFVDFNTLLESVSYIEQHYPLDWEAKLFYLATLKGLDRTEEVIEKVDEYLKTIEQIGAKAHVSSMTDIVSGIFDIFRLNAVLDLENPELLEQYDDQITLLKSVQLEPGAEVMADYKLTILGTLERARFMARFGRENEVMNGVLEHIQQAITPNFEGYILYAYYARHEMQDKKLALEILNALIALCGPHVDMVELHKDLWEEVNPGLIPPDFMAAASHNSHLEALEDAESEIVEDPIEDLLAEEDLMEEMAPKKEEDLVEEALSEAELMGEKETTKHAEKKTKT